jgi:hypothetical protein
MVAERGSAAIAGREFRPCEMEGYLLDFGFLVLAAR